MLSPSLSLPGMAQVLVRNLDDAVVALLKQRAALHGNSLEQELRDILTAAAAPPGRTTLAAVDRIRTATPKGEHTDSVDLLREDRSR